MFRNENLQLYNKYNSINRKQKFNFNLHMMFNVLSLTKNCTMCEINVLFCVANGGSLSVLEATQFGDPH